MFVLRKLNEERVEIGLLLPSRLRDIGQQLLNFSQNMYEYVTNFRVIFKTGFVLLIEFLESLLLILKTVQYRHRKLAYKFDIEHSTAVVCGKDSC